MNSKILRPPIAYQRAFVDITGDVACALYLSQLLYWWNVYKGEIFWMTDECISEQTGLTLKQIKRCKSVLRKKGYIVTTRKGIPARTFYEIVESKIEKDLLDLVDQKEEKKKTVTKTPTEGVEKIELGVLDESMSMMYDMNENEEKQNCPEGKEEMGQKVPNVWSERDKHDGTIGTGKEITYKTKDEIKKENKYMYIYPQKQENEVKKSNLSIDFVVQRWNEFARENGLATIRAVTEKRRRHILARIREPGFDLDLILEKIRASDFLMGRKVAWRVDFDFVFCSANNWIKILEGKYDNVQVKGGRYKDFDKDVGFLMEALDGRD